MSHLHRSATTAHVRIVSTIRSMVDRARAEAGEGVISAAIVVLIMALLGAAMWALFNGVFTNAGNQITDNVNQIGG